MSSRARRRVFRFSRCFELTRDAALRRKKAIVWDEDNLKQHEATRTPKMKIDEPKTPFNHAYDAAADADDDDDNNDNNDNGTARADVQAAAAKAVAAAKKRSAAQIDAAALEAKILSVADEQAQLGDDVWHPHADVKQRNEFLDHRRKHYNEYQMARLLAERKAAEEDDDDDDDDDDDGGDDKE